MSHGTSRAHYRNGMTEAQRKLLAVLEQSYMPNLTMWSLLEEYAGLDTGRRSRAHTDANARPLNPPKVVARA